VSAAHAAGYMQHTIRRKKMDKADTAFILAAAGLVLLMTPGLALFYGGMVRRKNVLGTIMQSLILIAVISIEWVYLGYSMSFGPDVGGFIGDLSWFALQGVTNAPSPDYATTIPQTVFMIYQCMFAIITPALITGAFAERVRFVPFLVFSLFWAILVYNPVLGFWYSVPEKATARPVLCPIICP